MNDWSEMEIMAYNDQPIDDESPTTGRIGRALVWALNQVDIWKMQRDIERAAEDARKAHEVAQRIEQRELRAKNAALAAYKMETKDK